MLGMGNKTSFIGVIIHLSTILYIIVSFSLMEKKGCWWTYLVVADVNKMNTGVHIRNTHQHMHL